MLRSGPKVFNAVADAMQWIFEQHGVKPYLDDFLIIGAPITSECKQALETVLGLCRRLGIPISVHKTEGPSVVLIFLGVELDTQKNTVTQGKLAAPEERSGSGKIAGYAPKGSCYP